VSTETTSDAKKALTEEDLKFSTDEFMAFLEGVGRSTSCPLCPHDGAWIFHTTSSGEPDSKMVVYTIQSAVADKEYTPVVLMECPNCGFMPSTSLFAVVDYFRKKNDG
tara:strand:+ start:5260 stop:5583 length:324 start_codon:yes stop_codon:yes gene_type:complete